ncbi:hypothetical protein [Streptomyces ardesiacus]|uniref:hypothetical protein n=1 Tax=Streptomyces ardesiacus TaxID=285564 RepID=UPI000D59C10A|nr:hypothetical protein [Streptomyces ardesiacus]
MRMPRFLARRPRPAAILAAGLATTLLGTAAVLSPVTADAPAGRSISAPHATATAFASTAPAMSDDEVAAAYNEGWTEGQDDFMGTGCAEPVPTAPEDTDPLVTAYNDGWIDGQYDLIDSGACEPDKLHAGAVTALPQTPGTEQWANALRALDHKQRNA